MARTEAAAAPWLDIMRARLGVAELAGRAANNNEILSRFALVGHPDIETDETAWCAAEVGAALVECGLPTPPRAFNLMARSYLTYGRALKTPVPGAIAVWPRGKPPSGHVNVVERVNGDGTVTCIDGNTGNKVSRTTRPIADALAFRWPVAAEKRALLDAGSTDLIAAAGLKRVAGVAATLATGSAAVKQAAPDAAPIAAAVPSASPAPAADLITTLDLPAITDQVTAAQTFMEAVNALASVAVANPWLAGSLVGSLAVWWLAVRLERHRVARAAAGHALSVEG